MPDGDGSRRITRKRANEDKRANEEFEHHYNEGMKTKEGGPPSKKTVGAILPSGR